MDSIILCLLLRAWTIKMYIHTQAVLPWTTYSKTSFQYSSSSWNTSVHHHPLINSLNLQKVKLPLIKQKEEQLSIIAGWRPVIINDSRTSAKESFIRSQFFTSDMINFQIPQDKQKQLIPILSSLFNFVKRIIIQAKIIKQSDGKEGIKAMEIEEEKLQIDEKQDQRAKLSQPKIPRKEGDPIDEDYKVTDQRYIDLKRKYQRDMAKAREEKEKYIKMVKDALAAQWQGSTKGIDQIQDEQQLEQFVLESQQKEQDQQVEILALKEQLLKQQQKEEIIHKRVKEVKMPYVQDHSDRDHVSYIKSLSPMIDYEKFEEDSDIEENDDTRKDFIKQKGARELTRGDKAALLAAGVKGILTKMGEYTNTSLPIDLNLDRSSKLKSSIIHLQFLAFKPSQSAYYTNASPYDRTSIYNEAYSIPKSFYFSFKFFDKPKVITENVVYTQGTVKPKQSVVLLRENYVVSGFETKELFVDMEFDASSSPSFKLDGQAQEEYYECFLQYLHTKSLTVDVWDADSMMFFGSFKVPLRGLLRQGRMSVISSKEYQITHESFTRPKGYIQLLIKNAGKMQQVQLTKQIIESDELEGTTAKKLEKKVVRVRQPLDVPRQFKENLSHDVNYIKALTENESQRNLERIKRLKNAVNNKKQTDFQLTAQQLFSPLQDEITKEKNLLQVQLCRESKKISMLQNQIQYNSEIVKTKVMQAYFGKVKILELDFQNPFESEAVFSINIDDKEETLIDKSELVLIKDPLEWQHYVNKYSFKKPGSYSCITQRERQPTTKIIIDSQYFCTLQSRERCTFLFKYKTERPYMGEAESQFIEEGNVELLKQFNRERVIQIQVKQISSKKLLKGMRVHVKPFPEVIDHNFKFYLPENRITKFNVPLTATYTQIPEGEPNFFASYDKAFISWENHKSATIQLKTPGAGEILKFNLLCYEDEYRSELVGSWIIECFSLRTVDAQVQMGYKTIKNLSLFSDKSRMVKLYSSHPLLAYFGEEQAKEFPVTAVGSYNIPLQILSFSDKPKNVQINCVDFSTKELIYSWLIRIQTSMPNITLVKKITCRINEISIQRFTFKNKSKDHLFYQFYSSHPNILTILQSKIYIEAGAEEHIKLEIKPFKNPGIASIVLFALDEDEKIFETILLRISFIK